MRLPTHTNEMLPSGPALEFIFAVDLWMLGHATKLYVDLVAEEVEELASRVALVKKRFVKQKVG